MKYLLIICMALACVARANASEFNFNTGVATIGPIPGVYAEVEYRFLKQSVRANYVSSLGVDILGSSEYTGSYFDYTFLRLMRGKRDVLSYFVTAGRANKDSSNLVDDEIYKQFGAGMEFTFQKYLFAPRLGNLFIRVIVTRVNIKHKPEGTRASEVLYTPSFVFGGRF